ncbi:uncharacterized protein LOC141693642 [Apium graveolens]|uniref:uncharacterized protein LOC141693642 n=1 Tax=Apium graveolens TaxID=4045 RepID=UPI003D799AF9
MEGGEKAVQNKEKGKSLVKEAVALFEERRAADVQSISKPRGEVDYLTTKLEKVTLELNETKQELNETKQELNETKQNLQKSVEEGMVMATCLSILHKELEQTKRELQELKEKDLYFRYKSSSGPSEEDWVEKDVRHVDETKIEMGPDLVIKKKEQFEFQKKHVNDSNEPSITKFIVPEENPILERRPSLRTKKKKALLAGIFSRRKGSKEDSNLEEFDYGEQFWS